jgi:hypothetical protein
VYIHVKILSIIQKWVKIKLPFIDGIQEKLEDTKEVFRRRHSKNNRQKKRKRQTIPSPKIEKTTDNTITKKRDHAFVYFSIRYIYGME